MKQILDNVESKMKKAADNLEANLRTIRTGRANANMLERVSVEYYGSPTPINQISSIQMCIRDRYKLYHLIYSRTMASLMAPSKSDAVAVKIESDGCQFSANGSTMTFDGYLKVYGKYEQEKDDVLPPLEVGEELTKVCLVYTSRCV